MAYYSTLDVEMLDYISDMQLIAADQQPPSEEELELMEADFNQRYSFSDDVSDDWECPW